MLKSGIKTVIKGELQYIANQENRPMRFRPWLGDSLSFLYDSIMKRSVFPKKFAADQQKHDLILKEELSGFRKMKVLELGTGTGSAASFLGSDNQYTGTDISPGLLKKAAKRFLEKGFRDPKFYVVAADELPFENESFNLCLCILSLNFFGETEAVLQEIRRVLMIGGAFVCCVPVPEKKGNQSKIRGVLHTEMELGEIVRKLGFEYARCPRENGALLYFKAIKRP